MFRRDKIFHLNPDGVRDLDYGQVLESNLSVEDLAADICVDGSVAPYGRLKDVTTLNGIPLTRTDCHFDGPRDQPHVEPGPDVQFDLSYDSESGNR